jgi:AraC family transcriptional regulator, regulatory protein of adaptative response / methylated-DNA-[protein]-cysteine methyltransferase
MQRAPDPRSAWRAVEARDARADGRFVYAVRSTGIYCRPSCPSRRPRRDRVEFFAAPADAEQGGFRACRRCRPERRVAPLAERARAIIDAAAGANVPLARLAAELSVSPAHLQRTFARVEGMSPRVYAERVRGERMRQSLRAGRAVSRATYDAGFNSSSRAYAASARMLGMTPGSYRRGGAGMEIQYAVINSSLGQVLVARTDRGICAVYPGDSLKALERQLADEFPRALRRKVTTPFAEARQVRDALDKGAATLPAFDLSGTDFQRHVWAALARIPAGQTRSYGEVASSIGRAGSARAVARACATNNVAVLVPCHRVVRGDGALGGYRWGLERKKALLAREAGAARP